MDFDKLVAVSGMPGLYKMVSNRSNGLVVENLDTGKVKFASTRKHQFTPLASIAIFTDDEDESVELKNVFKTMLEKMEEIPPVKSSAGKNELMEYLEKILPTYDRDRVYPGDVKKLIKWFNFLKERDLLKFEEEKEETKTSDKPSDSHDEEE